MSVRSTLSILALVLVAGSASLTMSEKAEAYGSYRTHPYGDSYGRYGGGGGAQCVKIPNLSKDGKTIFYTHVCPYGE
jgi:hypothetical protein